MTVTSTKRLLISKSLPWIVALAASQACTASAEYLFSGSFEGRAAWHSNAPGSPASDHFTLTATQSADLSSNWSMLLGFRAWGETIYGSHPDIYPSDVAAADSSEIKIRDAYLQYKGGHLFLRIGNQQVVWGEAFGFLFSDIINPKDLREGGFGDASEVRMQSPILNAKLVFSRASLQLIYVARPFFNLLPLPGSDFAYPFTSGTNFTTVRIRREQTLPTLTTGIAEYGGKLNVLLGQLDLSGYYFYYFDRNPFYRVNPLTDTQTLVLEEDHSRVDTTGLTATYEMAGAIIRMEGLRTFGRYLPLITQAGASRVTSDETIGVLGFDFPTFKNINFGLQWSRSDLSRVAPGLLRAKTQSLASAHLHYSHFKGNALDLVYSKDTLDQGEQYRLDYLVPLSPQIEMHLGAEILSGPELSEFGKLRRASRYFITLKSFFRG